MIRLTSERFVIAPVDENGPTSCPLACFDVLPTVADDEAPRQVDMVFPCSSQDQPGKWLSTIAPIPVVMIANENVIQLQSSPELCIDCFSCFPVLSSTGDVGLIADHNQAKSRVSESVQG